MVQYRVLVFNGGKDEEVGGIWDGVWDVVCDFFIWLFCGMYFVFVIVQSFKDFLLFVSVFFEFFGVLCGFRFRLFVLFIQQIII